MSAGRIEAAVARRASLAARAQADRGMIASDLDKLSGPLRIADTGWSALRWLRERPLIVAAAGTAFAVVAGRRPRRLMMLARLGLGAWQAWGWMSKGKVG